MLYKAEGIVLRTYPFGEANRVVVLLTAEHGKVRAVAKGVSRGKSRLAAAVQPFTHARFLLWQGRQLDGINQAEIVRPSHTLTGDLGAIAAAAYATELADTFWEERQEAPEAFALLRDGLQWLPGRSGEERQAFLRWLQLRTLALAGFQPELECCAHCGAELQGPRLRYAPDRGGLCCAECAAAGPWVGPGGASWLRQLVAADLPAVPPPPGPGALAEVTAALDAHVTFVAGRPLRARALLDTLG